MALKDNSVPELNTLADSEITNMTNAKAQLDLINNELSSRSEPKVELSKGVFDSVEFIAKTK